MQDTDRGRMTIAILEDNSDRTAAMDELLADKFPFFRRKFARSAYEAIAWLEENWASVICLCLDHDLEPCQNDQGDFDPGTGRQVSNYLAGKSPAFPVVIHTSNHSAALGMEADLSEAGWSVSRVTPFEDVEWIGTTWLPVVRNVIVNSASTSRSPAETPATRVLLAPRR